VDDVYFAKPAEVFEVFRRRLDGATAIAKSTNPSGHTGSGFYIRFGNREHRIESAFPGWNAPVKSTVMVIRTKAGLVFRQVAEWSTGYSSTAEYVASTQFDDVIVTGAWQFLPSVDPLNATVPLDYATAEDHHREVMKTYLYSTMPFARMLIGRSVDVVRSHDFVGVGNAVSRFLSTQ